MKKLLKIKFVKFERALVAQQLAIIGSKYFKETTHVRQDITFDMLANEVNLLIMTNGSMIDTLWFDTNTARDEYLEKVIKWISEEQFATGGKLEVGKLCEVSLCEGTEVGWVQSKLLAILPKYIENRYITQNNLFKNDSVSWTYARPIASCVQPKVNGDVYTWEMEVSE